MSHYFTYDPTLKEHIRNIKFNVLGKEINLISDSGVFSNKEVDRGSLIFVNSLINQNLVGNVLDLGCGYGTIGISLKLVYGDKINVDFSDVNPKCVELTSRNLKYYDLDGKCYISDSYSNIPGTYDFILFNPPISVGKEKIFEIYSETKKHLNKSGKFYLVIRKDKGGLSHMKYLSSLFSDTSVIYKEKGYLVIECDY